MTIHKPTGQFSGQWEEDGSGNLVPKDDEPIVVSGATVNGDLQIATGQSIDDGNGTTRLELLSSQTTLHNEDGTNAIKAEKGARLEANAYSSTPFIIADNEGSFDAVQYDTDGTAGRLHAKNAGIGVTGDHKNNAGIVDGLNLRAIPSNNAVVIEAADPGVTAYDIQYNGLLHDFSPTASNIRIATGQAIEDGSGTTRIGTTSGETFINNGDGNTAARFTSNDTRLESPDSSFVAINIDDVDGVSLRTNGTHPLTVSDQQGSFTALKYLPSASAPGSLQLINSVLSMRPTGGGVSWKHFFNTGATNDGAHIRGNNSGGTTEIEATDGAGNTTTLT